MNKRVTKLMGLVAAVWAAAASAQVVTNSGNIVIVGDTTGGIHGSQFLQSTFCKDAYNSMRAQFPDDFDGIISFSASDLLLMETQNTWQGTPVRTAASGIGRGSTAGALLPNPFGGSYNGTKISECVFMGTLGRTTGLFPGAPGVEPLPPNPDSITRAFGGLFEHLTGVEMLGHEYGHHWLMGVMYDKNDGRGPQSLLRGFEDGAANQHYNANADSHSVMYGSIVTDLGNGQFELAGGVRKYNHFDQYLMGLRAPSEVQPMLIVDDGTGEGDPSQPLTRGATRNVSGTATYVDIADVIRAEGPRVPAYGAGAQNCWRVAFVVVLPQGVSAVPPAMLQKVEAYRQRFGPWFNEATDCRGYMDTRLFGTGCQTVPIPSCIPDGGVAPDAGTVDPDAGTVEPDAGTVDPDAGTVQPDAGVTEDGGLVENPNNPDAGDPYEYDPYNTGKIRPGCGCTGVEGFGVLGLLSALGLLARRRRG